MDIPYRILERLPRWAWALSRDRNDPLRTYIRICRWMPAVCVFPEKVHERCLQHRLQLECGFASPSGLLTVWLGPPSLPACGDMFCCGLSVGAWRRRKYIVRTAFRCWVAYRDLVRWLQLAWEPILDPIRCARLKSTIFLKWRLLAFGPYYRCYGGVYVPDPDSDLPFLEILYES